LDRSTFTGGDTCYLTFKLLNRPDHRDDNQHQSHEQHKSPSLSVKSTLSRPKIERESTIASFASNLPKLTLTRSQTKSSGDFLRRAAISFRIEETQTVRAPRNSIHIDAVNEANPSISDSFVGGQMSQMTKPRMERVKLPNSITGFVGFESRNPDDWIVSVKDTKKYGNCSWTEAYEGEFSEDYTVCLAKRFRDDSI
jgi:hypothetical protein